MMWLGLAGCSTEVDLIAPYDSFPVVYGLLELDADTQWVKINRTWLGEGDNREAAMIPDSSEYPSGAVIARIVELNPSSSGQILGNELPTGNVWALRDTVLFNKSTEGSFFGPNQRVYFASTTSEALSEDKWYRLELELPNGGTAQATTTMIQGSGSSVNYPPNLNSVFQMDFATINNGVPTYQEPIFRWTTAPGASLYTASLVVHFVEKFYADPFWTSLDSVRERSIRIGMGSRPVGTSPDMEQTFNTERLYTELASRLEVNPRVRRELGVFDEEVQKERAFDFELQIANRDLATYLDVNESAISIVQDRPLWTNVQGGIGLWGARSTTGVYGWGYRKQTIQHLQESDLTAALNFCSPSPFSDYSCQ